MQKFTFPIKTLWRASRNIIRGYLSIPQAMALNEALFSDVHVLSESEWNDYGDKIRRLCITREYSPDWTLTWVSHRYRLYLTTQWLEEIIPTYGEDIVAIDLGGISIVMDILQETFPHVQWQNTTGDLRYPWKMDDQSVDLIVCTEVLEHLSDLPSGYNDTFYMTGFQAVLKECHRVLKHGGTLFITTPNAASVFHLVLALNGQPPWFFMPHVREYTIDELLTEVEAVGFSVERWKTVHCLNVDIQNNYTTQFRLLLSYGYKTDDRGDNVFMVARK